MIPLLARTTSLAWRYPCSICAASPEEGPPCLAPNEILRSPTSPEQAPGVACPPVDSPFRLTAGSDVEGGFELDGWVDDICPCPPGIVGFILIDGGGQTRFTKTFSAG